MKTLKIKKTIPSIKRCVCFALLLAIDYVYAAPPVDTLQQPIAVNSTIDKPLNSKLREAMALYYNQQYRLALPLLQDVAHQDDRTQILFWLGRAAYETGQTDVAIEKYEKILAREPKLSRVRLELAAAYLQAGNKSRAQAELEKIVADNPNTELKQQIQQTLTELEQPTTSSKQWFASVRATIGTAYDSNINSATSRDIQVAGNTTQVQIPSQVLDGWLLKFNINADALYDFGKPNGFAWHNHLQFLHHEYPDPTNNNFNYTQTDVNTGLDYYDARFKVRAPVGFIDRRFDNKALSSAYYFMPNLEINILNNTDVTLAYRYENEDFVNSLDNLSNRTHSVNFGPRYKFQALDAEHLLSLTSGYSRRNANLDIWSYHEWSLGPSYFAHFKTGTELYLDFKFFNRDYDAKPSRDILQLSELGNGIRKDDRYALTFAVSQTFYQHYFASLNYSYTDNRANAEFFNYSKHMVGLNIGTNLGF